MINIITVWPDNLDYPLFRLFLEKHPNVEVTIGITQKHMDLNLSDFILKNVRGSFIVRPEEGDWRDVATRQALERSAGEWVWFLEPDFFMKNPHQFLDLPSMGRDVYGFAQGNRLHPCCLMVKRDVLMKTCLDFSAKPPEYDHFGAVTQELMNTTNWGSFTDFGLVEGKDWYHHAGLSQNYTLAQQGKKPNYNLENFALYNRASLTAEVIQDPRYIELAQKTEEMIAPIGRFL